MRPVLNEDERRNMPCTSYPFATGILRGTNRPVRLFRRLELFHCFWYYFLIVAYFVLQNRNLL